jgi:N-acetylglucosaminyldiphosphoundecaprenol N-acetyl-beta-D-mannosaminyltransferase
MPIFPHKHDILGTHISAITLTDLRDVFDMTIAENGQLCCYYANAHLLNLTWENADLRRVMNDAEIVFCDGFGAMLVAKLLGKSLPERMTPPDWLAWIGRHWAKKGYRLFLLGGAGDVAQRTAEWYKEHFPNIQIVGTHHGYFDKNGAESEAVIAKINDATPDILIVGFGMPMQEFWCDKNRAMLSVSVLLTVGAAMDYLSGTTKRAPQWATNRGLEWLGRLLIEPRRLWRRYVIGLPILMSRAVGYRLNIARPRVD